MFGSRGLTWAWIALLCSVSMGAAGQLPATGKIGAVETSGRPAVIKVVLLRGAAPVAGATVRVTDETGNAEGLGETDARGVARVATSTGRRILRVVSGATATEKAVSLTTAQQKIHVELPKVGAHLQVEMGHTLSSANMRSAAFSADGGYLLTSDSIGMTVLWEVKTARVLRVFHTGWSDLVAFAPDMRTVVVGGDGATMFDTASGTLVWHFGPSGPGSQLNAVAYSPDGRFVATAGNSDGGTLWDAQTGKRVRSLCLQDCKGWHGDLQLAFGQGHTALLWDSKAFAEIDFTTGHAKRTVAWQTGTKYLMGQRSRLGASGRTMVFSAKDGTVRLVSMGDGREQAQVRGSGGEEDRTVANLSPDGQYLLQQGERGDARLYDSGSGRQLGRDVKKDFADGPAEVLFSPDGQHALVESLNGNIDMYRVSKDGLTAERTFQSEALPIDQIKVFAAGRRVLVGAYSNLVRKRPAVVWDVDAGREVQRLELRSGTEAMDVTEDGHYAFFVQRSSKRVVLWNLETGTEAEARDAAEYAPEPRAAARFAPDGQHVLIAHGTKLLMLGIPGLHKEWEKDVGSPVGWVAFSPDGKRLALSGGTSGEIWDVGSRRKLSDMEAVTGPIEYSKDGRTIVVATGNGPAIVDGDSGRVLSPAKTKFRASSATFSADGRRILTANEFCSCGASLVDAVTGKTLLEYSSPENRTNVALFLGDDTRMLTGGNDGALRLWDVATGTELATLLSGERQWLVMDPLGRFDAGDLSLDMPIHWRLDDEPLKTYPPALLMRDFYTPSLLRRIMHSEPLPAVRKLSEIPNRLQPVVKISAVSWDEVTHKAKVTVWAESAKARDGTTSGLTDLRVFRDGHLVAMLPGDVKEGEHAFQVALPNSGLIDFSAYSFSRERIKSETAHEHFDWRGDRYHQPQAFLLQVGVNHYMDPSCELHYPVNDAKATSEALIRRLQKSYTVRAMLLTSLAEGMKPEPLPAPKARAVHIDIARSEIEPVIATVSPARKQDVKRALAWIASEATPNDMVVVSFSGHGYSEVGGQFYVLPSDVQGDCRHPDRTLTASAISADELAEWLRPVDAGEMTLILDACYSAESVQAGDFKPGPMGSKGLGQLAYDKRMRVLAASQADAVAHEYDYLQQGLLTYVLMHDGLQEGKADWKPKDGKITVGEWLAYAANAVPQFGKKAGDATRAVQRMDEKGAVVVKSGVQVPALFDFANTDAVALK